MADTHHAHARTENRKGLTFSLFITIGVMLLELIGGILTNSLALLSDSGHMLSDASSLVLSLGAIWLSSRPPSPRKTYGYYRFEILAAFINGVTLFVIAGFIIWEAYGRFLEPPVVAGSSMIVIAFVGLLANASSALVLIRKGDVKENLNIRSAYLHVIGDALGSIGAIVAGLLMLLFSWYIADPIISVLVALLILRSAWGIFNNSVHILMEGTPETVEHDEVQKTLQRIPGVKGVHDLHIWSITSGLDSLSCHLTVDDEADEQSVLNNAIKTIEEHYQIKHATIQIEKSRIQHSNNECCY
ncbi:MAG: cation transporter [Firmicutes bacterium]|nr:cation transporter [Bacillota bacterium]